MSILIKGLHLPKDKQLRIVLNPNGQLFVDHGITFTEYESVELPDHGDLIDRDALKEKRWCDTTRYGDVEVVGIWHINDAPTVIEAERSE